MRTAYTVQTLPRSHIATLSAIGIIACALSDMVHEILGHATAAWWVGDRIVSLSTVALQTAGTSRWVSAAGTSANLIIGAVSLACFNRTSGRTNWTDFLWSFAALNLLNSGYLIASALLGNGDWAAVISGLSPAWVWRCALGIAGAAIYAGSMRWLALSMARRVEQREVAPADPRRLAIAVYLSGAVVLTIASLFNPISPSLIFLSGMGASFGLSAGLLFVPGIIERRIPAAPDVPSTPTAPSVVWVSAAVVVGIVFIAVLGPGIQLDL